MDTYRADKELENILINNGFIETTSEENRKKGKKSFKTSKNARKRIYFDYINIKILKGSHIMDDCYEMTEKELKLLLLYFKLNYVDRKKLSESGIFNFKKINERFVMIVEELKALKEFNIKNKRQITLERIIKTYETITLKNTEYSPIY